jgi:hypothetical protein
MHRFKLKTKFEATQYREEYFRFGHPDLNLFGNEMECQHKDIFH